MYAICVTKLPISYFFVQFSIQFCFLIYAYALKMSNGAFQMLLNSLYSLTMLIKCSNHEFHCPWPHFSGSCNPLLGKLKSPSSVVCLPNILTDQQQACTSTRHPSSFLFPRTLMQPSSGTKKKKNTNAATPKALQYSSHSFLCCMASDFPLHLSDQRDLVYRFVSSHRTPTPFDPVRVEHPFLVLLRSYQASGVGWRSKRWAKKKN